MTQKFTEYVPVAYSYPSMHLIISKTPFRLSLGGGGTDLPHYYQKHGAHIVTAAVQKYVYVLVKRWFEKGIRVSYSKTEVVPSIEDIEHPVVREALRLLGPNKQIEIVSMADIPARTGMGSSASFTVGLLNALFSINKMSVDAKSLAEMAFRIQSEILKEDGGKQDQYAAAYGGIISLRINRAGKVVVKELRIKDDAIGELENNLLCFYTGIQRNSADVHKGYLNPSAGNSSPLDIEDRLSEIKLISMGVEKALEEGNLNEFGSLLHRHWLCKRSLCTSISNEAIDKWYDKGLTAGAIGGKVMGAGGGGFLLFYCENANKKAIRKEMANEGLEEIKLRFEFQGSKIAAHI